MKIRTFFFCLMFVFMAEAAAVIFFAVWDTKNIQDAVAVNEAVYSVQEDWEAIESHKNHTGLDYAVLDLDGNVRFQTKPELSISINQAVIHKDTILDLNVDGAVVGKIIIYNDSMQIFRKQKQTILMILAAAMLVLSLVIVFSGMMTKNMITDMTPFINLIVGETADSCMNVNIGIEDKFLREMHADERVEKVYMYHSEEVRHADGVGLMANICDDYSKVNNKNVVFEGRFPKFENEIAVAAKYAKEKGLEIGNAVTITAGGKEEEYIISGFTQISNNLGKDCLLTRDGYKRLGELQNVSYYLNLAEGTDIDAFHKEAENLFENEINSATNINGAVEGTASVYVSLMVVIVAAILILSAVVIIFVLYLLVRTMLGNKMKEYGILKAIGFTSGQLIVQTALSFMPTVICSAAVGLAVCSFMINPLTALFLSGIGIVKCNFTIPTDWIAAAGMGMILFVFGMLCLLAVKIKKIAPRELLAEE